MDKQIKVKKALKLSDFDRKTLLTNTGIYTETAFKPFPTAANKNYMKLT